MTKTKLPAELGQHHEYTALFSLSHHSAHVYALEGDSIEQLTDLTCPDLDCDYQDNEGFSMSGGHGTNSAHDGHSKEHDERVFVNHLIEYIRKMEMNRKPKHMVFYAPKDIMNLVEEKLPKDLHEKSVVHGLNLWNASAHEIVERMKG